MSENKGSRRSSPDFHQTRDDDDPLLGMFRRAYLGVLSRETKRIPDSLRTVLDGKVTALEDWFQQVHFSDEWLRAAARFTLAFWRKNRFDEHPLQWNPKR